VTLVDAEATQYVGPTLAKVGVSQGSVSTVEAVMLVGPDPGEG
jgi:hypothetical protein